MLHFNLYTPSKVALVASVLFCPLQLNAPPYSKREQLLIFIHPSPIKCAVVQRPSTTVLILREEKKEVVALEIALALDYSGTIAL